MKPICVPCQRFYRVKKSGFPFIEAMPIGPEHVEPGTAEADRWKPYKLWYGDLWECGGCGSQIVSGVAHNPVSEHYQDDFDECVATLSPKLQVNDC